MQWRIRSSASPDRGSSPCRHALSWKAASATTLVPAVSNRRRTSKKVVNVRSVKGSPGPGLNPPGWAWTMPSLISSLLTSGQWMACASALASVVLPVPGEPLTMMRVGEAKIV